MRIQLLGTGSADGWPNPFCACASCDAERAAGRLRRPSSALVDGRILLDCGPTAPHTPVSLREVQHLLVTHGHHDHLEPSLLLTRAWTDVDHVLHVWGPRVAISSLADWIGPDAPVELHVVEAGDVVRLPTEHGAYAAQVLAAEHHHGDGDVLAQEAVLYLVTARDGQRLLYATDTGPLAPATIDAIGARVDAALLDETFGDHVEHGQGHLDLSTLPTTLSGMREAGVVDDATIVAAIHLSHHNPPTEELRRRLAPIGVLVPEDLDVLDTSVAGGRAPSRVLLLGGTRSGKSVRAEATASSFLTVDYVATGGTRPEDPEWADRVALHRARRPAHWTTHETTDIASVLGAARSGGCVVVDCLTLWLTDVLDSGNAWTRAESGDRRGVADDVDVAVDKLIAAVEGCAATVVFVSNEVGLGVIADTASGRLFADLLGRVNARMANTCDDVTLMVAGRVLSLKDSGRQ